MAGLFDFLDDDEPVIQLDTDDDGVTLRPYQREAVDAVFREWDRGNKSTLLVLATGLGKTVCFSEVMKRYLESAS